jgi:hypothetical protein
MKNGKRQPPERKPAREKSRGTTWAERTRSHCNTLTPAQREALLDRALRIAYGAEAEPAAAGRL